MSRQSEGSREAYRIWSSKKGINAKIPHELECLVCGKKSKSADCSDLKLYEINRGTTFPAKMSVRCPTPNCSAFIIFRCELEKAKRKKPKVR